MPTKASGVRKIWKTGRCGRYRGERKMHEGEGRSEDSERGDVVRRPVRPGMRQTSQGRGTRPTTDWSPQTPTFRFKLNVQIQALSSLPHHSCVVSSIIRHIHSAHGVRATRTHNSASPASSIATEAAIIDKPPTPQERTGEKKVSFVFLSSDIGIRTPCLIIGSLGQWAQN